MIRNRFAALKYSIFFQTSRCAFNAVNYLRFSLYIALIFYVTICVMMEKFSVNFYFLFFRAYIDFAAQRGRAIVQHDFEGVNYTEPLHISNMTLVFNGPEVTILSLHTSFRL